MRAVLRRLVFSCVLSAAAAARAGMPGNEIRTPAESQAPRPGLTLPAPRVLAPGSQMLEVRTMFHGNYPVLGIGFAEGMAGGLELAGAGRFDHSRVDWPNTGGRHDADEFQGELRWGTPVASGFPAGLAIAAGFTKAYDRTKWDDGRYAFATGRSVWGEFAAGAGIVSGARFTVAERYLRDVESRTDVHASVFGAESPDWNGVSLLAEAGVLLRHPSGWRAPWAAGIRLPAGGQAFDVFLSNTFGAPVPDALRGGAARTVTCRILLSI
jgi:hypothetical protein